MRGLIIIYCLFLLAACEVDGQKSDEENLNLVWSDEFDYNGAPDNAKWGYNLGNGCPTLCGWGNNELQHYTNKKSNVRVADGKLIIEAIKKNNSEGYTSARLTTKNKGDWKYGKIEVKARIPKGKGTWPGIWMLPTDWAYGDWPKSGEIDIMEHVGYDKGNIHGTVHTETFNHIKGSQKGDSIRVPSASEAFHIYAINWNSKKIDFLVDGEVYHTFNNNGDGSGAWPFDQPFYLLINIAVGGNWGGKMGVDEKIWPQRMEIDYVRVYKQSDL